MQLAISLIQADLIWEQVEANLAYFATQIEQLSQPSDLILLPEMFSTGFSMNVERLAESMDGPSVQWMAKQAKKAKAVVAGSLIIKEQDQYFNRLIWMRPDGTYEHYDKRHLFKMAGEHKVYSAGEKKLIVELKGWKIMPLVCYDLRFPVWSRNTEDYDLLLYLANWPEKRSVHWKSLLQARAIENQCYTIGLNRVGTDANNLDYSGDSQIINPLGQILFQSSYLPCHHQASLSKDKLLDIRKKLPFLQDRD